MILMDDIKLGAKFKISRTLPFILGLEDVNVQILPYLGTEVEVRNLDTQLDAVEVGNGHLTVFLGLSYIIQYLDYLETTSPFCSKHVPYNYGFSSIKLACKVCDTDLPEDYRA